MEANENLAFDALSDRIRRRILNVLGEEGELSVGEIVAHIDAVGRTTVSSHLRVLRTSGVVIERKSGRNRYYSLDREGTARDAFTYLQSLLHAGLDAVETSTPRASDAEPEDRGRGAG
ncbi:ArsR/SmtB family transcription factor [Actinomycetospora lemnae]|uniref:Metalloregulator ArsR/SmtB family transcription factor n=1 Tax=Actinomycetospora lemnae TaxID=3019891 RepID=A0ABT5SSC1_9PSEU|nr:metalloregulator ArsR/SmtB family transcription factor [Actinomycetospora sp. DW7H6]MDD7965375.1 metalloregulator ArsR/SmtB family transcription factor [Actinomycetospora sp. DW7H6]